MTGTETNALDALDTDEDLDELTFLQKQANKLIAYAVRRGWISRGEAQNLYNSVAAASVDSIFGVYMEIVHEVAERRAAYNHTPGPTDD